MLSLPALFLYVDFFAPLFFLFLIIFLSFFCVKILLKEFVYKFLVDLFAKETIYGLVNYKFFDLLLNNINSKGVTFFSFSGFLSNSYIKRLNFNSIMVVLMLFFFLIWGCILILKYVFCIHEIWSSIFYVLVSI